MTEKTTPTPAQSRFQQTASFVLATIVLGLLALATVGALVRLNIWLWTGR